MFSQLSDRGALDQDVKDVAEPTAVAPTRRRGQTDERGLRVRID
jgi:hypothetical protein